MPINLHFWDITKYYNILVKFNQIQVIHEETFQHSRLQRFLLPLKL